MSYTLVENFAGGVDRTRPRYVGPPGTLWSGINGHLTRGGDFEKRKAFVSAYSLPAGDTFGLAATADALYTFGHLSAPTVPAGVTYMQLQHPFDSSKEMTGIASWDLYDGKLYVVAEFEDGTKHHYYDGVHVMDWEAGHVVADFTDNDGIAEHLSGLMEDVEAVDVSAAANVITVEAAVAGTPFTLTATATNKDGGTDDQTAVVAETVANVTGVEETLSSVSFSITGGTNSTGVNTLSSITISGVEVLNTAVDWVTSNDVTAANIATQINSYNSTPEYTATASGQTVTIKAAAGTGDGPNGFTVSIVPAGDVSVDSGAGGATATKAMGGGIDAVAGQKQKATITIGGTFEVGDKFSIKLNGNEYGYIGRPSQPGSIVKTHRRKIYSPVGSILWFTQIDTANSVDEALGAGFQNMSTHQSGSSQVTGLGTFNDLLAAFSRRVIQIWNMQDNPDQNAPSQFLTETGTRSPRSVRGFGDIDCFYYSDSGIRSLRARSVSNLAGVNDVGTPIDTLVREYALTLTDAQIENAIGIVEPVDGRFWMALGERIFVFSYFPSKKISAWSWYEPGMEFSDLVTLNDRLYCRSGDTIYLYGGADNATFGSDYDVTAALPFLSGGKPGTFKHVKGIDQAAAGTWNCKIYVNPNDEDEYLDVGDLTGVTWPEEGVGVPGQCTHIAPAFTHRGEGYASLSQVGIYTDGTAEKI